MLHRLCALARIIFWSHSPQCKLHYCNINIYIYCTLVSRIKNDLFTPDVASTGGGELTFELMGEGHSEHLLRERLGAQHRLLLSPVPHCEHEVRRASDWCQQLPVRTVVSTKYGYDYMDNAVTWNHKAVSNKSSQAMQNPCGVKQLHGG